ncbi:MAG: hypothetical protein M3068_10765 [Gemmatimonadota bacterium]|nr:hypothetical protein [Gemmatimonadota bacterium]
MSAAGRRERLVDALGLLLLLIGGTLYARSYLGMRTLRDSAFVTGKPWAMVRRWEQLVTLSRWGLAVAAAGLLVLIGGAWLGSRARAERERARPPLADPTG